MDDVYLMSLDIGGSGGRCLLVNSSSGERFTTQRRWSHPPAPGLGSWAFDVDTDMVWRTMGDLSRQALQQAGIRPGQVAGIAGTGFRHGMFVIGADGARLFAVPTRDARAVDQGMTLAEGRGAEFYARTGHYPSPLMLASRLRYLVDKRPDIISRAQAVLSTDDWAAYLLSGMITAEATQVGETMLCDLKHGGWAMDLIDSLELPGHIFPRLVNPGEKIGGLTPTTAAHLSLPAGTPVSACAGDTQSALLGMGVATSGQYAVVAGSTAPAVYISSEPILDAQRRTWTGLHIIPGLYILESNAGQLGAGLEWIAELLYPGNPHAVAALIADSRSAPLGAGGAISSLGGQVFNAAGLSLPVDNLSFSTLQADGNHRSMLARAILEGEAFWLRANFEQLEVVSGDALKEIWMSGGMARSTVWCQLLCDVLGQPVHVQPDGETTALGAAICAGMGAGLFPDFKAGITALVKPPRVFEPEPGRSKLYEELFQRWEDLRQERAESDMTAASLLVDSIEEGQVGVAKAAWEAAKLRPSIFVSADAGPQAIDMLRELGEVTYESYREGALLAEDDLVEKLQGYSIFITEIDLLDAEVLRKLPDLRVVFACRNNPVNIDLDACTAAGVPVINTPGRNAEAVADLTLAFILALLRKLVPASAFLHEPGGEAGDLGRMGTAYTRFQGDELWGKAVGLVGAGAVGRKVIGRLLACGARVLVYDPYLSDDALALLGAEKVELEGLLAESDIISLHATVTDETRGMIDAAALANMKPGTLLINTARAALVDEAGLIEALQSGHLGGAALDVFSVEPPAADDPLLACPNLIATPHIGGNTHQVGLHQGMMIVAELGKMLGGKAPNYLLNPEALDHFRWSGPRQVLESELSKLGKGPAPSVTDLDQNRSAAEQSGQLRAVQVEDGKSFRQDFKEAKKDPAGQKAGGILSGFSKLWGGKAAQKVAEGGPPEVQTAPPPPGTGEFQPATQARVRFLRILETFLQRMLADPQVSEFAKGKNVTFLFTLRDLILESGAAQEFYMSFIDGVVKTGLGAPPMPTDVRLKMSCDILDGIFTTRVNPTKAAMTGKISFSGDTSKAMAFQKLQGGLQALYQQVRAEVGDPGDLTKLSAPTAATVSQPSTLEPTTLKPSTAPPPLPAPIMIKTGDARDELLAVTDEMYAKGLITATGGNLSIRLENEPGQAWITPSAVFKGDLKADMMVKIDLEGNVVDEGEYGYSASSERRVHTAIYKARPEIQAVIHSHAHYATLLALSGLKFLPISTEAAFIGDIPVVPFVMPGTSDLGEAVAREMGEKGFVVIMQHHGLVVAGSSLRRAADMSEVVETTAHAIITCRMMGVEPPVLPDEVVAQLREMGQMMA